MSEERQLALLLYRGLHVAAKRLSKEAVRRRSVDNIFLPPKREWVTRHVPELLPAVYVGLPAVKELIRKEFRNNTEVEPSSRSSRLDLGFACLRHVTSSLSLSEAHAVEGVSNCTTRGIRVQVKSRLSCEGSVDGPFAYVYKVKITNESCEQPVQVVSRHWRVLDAEGNEEAVIGPGVKGKNPVVKTGQEHEYFSFVPLKSRRGTLSGTYNMLGTVSGELFDVNIAPVALSPEFGIVDSALSFRSF